MLLVYYIGLCLSLSAIARAEKLIFSENFQRGLNPKIWKHEITMGGGGNQEFQYYINNRSNSFVRNNTLFIKPTLTSDRIGKDAVDGTVPTTLEIWGTQPADLCTGNQYYGCSRQSSKENNWVINPIQSARLRTANTFSFKYGRLEVEAKAPLGDWIFPAIWLLPEDQIYGAWPASGEIDLMESRGNDKNYGDGTGGVNCFATTLHWGPYFPADSFQAAHAEHCLTTGDLHEDFHIYGLYWSETEMYSYIDTPENKVLDLNYADKSFWDIGGFDQIGDISNPWEGRPNSAPFDQNFFLVFNVAVGGTNGYFWDGIEGKPWTNGGNGMQEFTANIDKATSTWVGDEVAMQIRTVKVWQL